MISWFSIPLPQWLCKYSLALPFCSAKLSSTPPNHISHLFSRDLLFRDDPVLLLLSVSCQPRCSNVCIYEFVSVPLQLDLSHNWALMMSPLIIYNCFNQTKTYPSFGECLPGSWTAMVFIEEWFASRFNQYNVLWFKELHLYTSKQKLLQHNVYKILYQNYNCVRI